jgi:replication fork protection complex subunit Csm3/Swi3
MYPRAKFADGLTIIEKLGHSKRMQLQRKAWIEEGKPRPSVKDEDLDYDAHQSDTERPAVKHGGEIAKAGTISSRSSVGPVLDGGEPITTNGDPESQQKPANNSLDQQGQGEPDEDELDALFAEEASESIGRPNPEKLGPRAEPIFDDDEEAMRDMDGMEELW